MRETYRGERVKDAEGKRRGNDSATRRGAARARIHSPHTHRTHVHAYTHPSRMYYPHLHVAIKGSYGTANERWAWKDTSRDRENVSVEK